MHEMEKQNEMDKIVEVERLELIRNGAQRKKEKSIMEMLMKMDKMNIIKKMDEYIEEKSKRKLINLLEGKTQGKLRNL